MLAKIIEHLSVWLLITVSLIAAVFLASLAYWVYTSEWQDYSGLLT